GERYVEGLASVEGGYERTGSRSPMAWDHTTNAGFSSAPKEDLYIAQGPTVDTVNVETERSDPNSVWNAVHELIALRKDHPALGNEADFTLLELQDHSYPLVYERTAENERILVVLNPSGQEAVMETALPASHTLLYAAGGMKGQQDFAENAAGKCLVPPASAAFFVLS
ncbi:MAG: glycosylase, partial [Lachnospiraceae bacterium]